MQLSNIKLVIRDLRLLIDVNLILCDGIALIVCRNNIAKTSCIELIDGTFRCRC